MKQLKLRNLANALISLVLLCAISGCNTVKQATRTPETDSLLRAAAIGNADSVKALLASPNVDVNGVDDLGNTSLIQAARLGHDDVVQALLIAKADVNKKNNDGKTALMLASEGGHEESVLLLTQAGAVNK